MTFQFCKSFYVKSSDMGLLLSLCKYHVNSLKPDFFYTLRSYEKSNKIDLTDIFVREWRGSKISCFWKSLISVFSLSILLLTYVLIFFLFFFFADKKFNEINLFIFQLFAKSTALQYKSMRINFWFLSKFWCIIFRESEFRHFHERFSRIKDFHTLGT